MNPPLINKIICDGGQVGMEIENDCSNYDWVVPENNHTLGQVASINISDLMPRSLKINKFNVDVK